MGLRSMIDESRIVALQSKLGAITRAHQRSRHAFAEALDERMRAIRDLTAAAAASGPAPLMAPMPGLVVRVSVGVGDTVSAGQGLVVVEAMKMENILFAAHDGVVKKVMATQGESLSVDQVIVEFEA